MRSLPSVLLSIALLLPAAGAVAVDARDRGFLSKGMAEGEVLLKIGPPDHESVTASRQGLPEEKIWTYFPHSRDPQTLTIITLRGGVIADIERKISR